MAGKTLTDARIGALVPRRTAYDIRDGKLRGFDVRLTPSGKKRFFVHCQHRGERAWKIVGERDGEADPYADTPGEPPRVHPLRVLAQPPERTLGDFQPPLTSVLICPAVFVVTGKKRHLEGPGRAIDPEVILYH